MSPASLPAENPDKGRHYEFIKSAVDDRFKTATLSRARALADVSLKPQAWFTSALPTQVLKGMAPILTPYLQPGSASQCQPTQTASVALNGTPRPTAR